MSDNDPWKQRRFAVDGGREEGDGCGGYCVAVTPEDVERSEQRSVADTRLYVLTSDYTWRNSLTVTEMTTISTIIETANARRSLR